jgi:hypothetical protein
MTVSQRGGVWKGTAASDLDEYLRAFAAEGHAVAEVVHAACSACGGGGAGFALALDDDEGVVVRRCRACGGQVPMLDSAQYLDDADLGDAACPCGNEVFDVAVGFALRDDAEVRWVSVGLRCHRDGLLGVYADWKIDYSPSRHLLTRV